MRRILFFLMLAFLCTSFNQWKMDYWEVLKGLERKAKYLPQSSSFESKVKFSKAVQRLEGKKIKLKGYFVKGWSPQDQASLTFCRYPDPEWTYNSPNVDEMVALEQDPEFTIRFNEVYHVEGILKLNAIDRFQLPYKLERVKCHSCKD